MFHLQRTQSSADFPIGQLAAQSTTPGPPAGPAGGLTPRRRVETVSEKSQLTGDGQIHTACAFEC